MCDHPPLDWDAVPPEPATDQGAQGDDEPVVPRPAIAAFAVAMEKRMRLNDHKPDPHSLRLGELDDLLREEVTELFEACSNLEVMHESEDVAIVALFYWMRQHPAVFFHRGRKLL